MKRVNVEVWSDFVCPWCWIAKRRLEKAIEGMA
ncbi:DsbA family protein, partial [Burkholderia cenocepacia]